MIVDEVQNMRYYLLSIVLTLSIHVAAQTKVSGTVYDQDNQPVAFANVMFKNSSEVFAYIKKEDVKLEIRK